MYEQQFSVETYFCLVSKIIGISIFTKYFFLIKKKSQDKQFSVSLLVCMLI